MMQPILTPDNFGFMSPPEIWGSGKRQYASGPWL